MAEPTLLPERLQYRPTKIELDESIEKAKATLLKKIKRSVYVYRVDCGGCNGCEIEILRFHHARLRRRALWHQGRALAPSRRCAAVHRRRDACHAYAGPARL